MIDYFALLEQQRAPWLDPDQLKQVYHRKTLDQHPDTQASRNDIGAAGTSFADLNEAYQVLEDPRRRLQHLLILEGCLPSSSEQAVPKQVHDLFPEIGALTQRAKLLLEKLRTSSNALSQSLLKPEILEVQNDTKELGEKMKGLTEASLVELRQINTAWANKSKNEIESVSNLYLTFAYLTRWSAQLDEIAFQLSLH